MHLQSYRLQNYRRLRNVQVDLAKDISIFVGANNSGKTSATHGLQMFLSGKKHHFSLFDFSSHCWKQLNDLGDADPAGDAIADVPKITLDLWFSVTDADLYLVLPILPSSNWEGTEVGMRIEFGARDVGELLQQFRTKKAEAGQQAANLGAGAGSYLPWPKTLTDFLEKELHREFEFRYFVLDRTKFDENYLQNDDYEPAPIVVEPGGGAILGSLIRIDCLHAQRHLADPSFGMVEGGGRAEDLSRRLSRFYQRNLEQRADDHSALKALFDSEESLNRHLKSVFEPTLKRIATLGYPGLHNPQLEITSGLNPASVMSQDAKVRYVLGQDTLLRLPDSYNGLGFKNLIFMVVEILDVQEKWRLEEPRPPLHLVFIEEPEAHLHSQLQQVFIRNILDLLKIDGEGQSVFTSQVVITTHSPHILYERGFAPIRYFRRHVTDSEQTTQVLNLSKFQAGDNPKDRDFLQRYLKLTHCDLFFADAAILVEGNVERLLLPLMIEKDAMKLRSAALCILEVGGAFGHRFRELIRFLGISTLIITDLDSVTLVPEAAAEADAKGADEDEDEPKEFEVPAEEAGKLPTKKSGKTCMPLEPDAVTANQTLIQWLPKKLGVTELLALSEGDKIEPIPETEKAKVRIAYQVATPVEWAGKTESLCGRTLEESFGLENAVWCQHADQQTIGLKLRRTVTTPAELAKGLHSRVTGKNFDKTKFALGVLARKDWNVPLYIKEGLAWLESVVDLETTQEVEAAAVALAVEATVGPEVGSGTL